MNEVGTSPRRGGGYGRVTGHQEYLADIRVADMLHSKLVTIDCARARIISIDASAAEKLPGVQFVMTPDDLPKPMIRFGPQFQDRPILADGEVKYHGEPVAAVVAETRRRSRCPCCRRRIREAGRWRLQRHRRSCPGCTAGARPGAASW